MRPLTPREKRTARIAAVLVALYLALFYGLEGWQRLEAERRRSDELRRALGEVRERIALEREKEAAALRLERTLAVDLEALEEETVVPESLAAIQKTAKQHGVVLESTKEVQERSAGSKELARFQLDGRGTVDAALHFIDRLPALGYPLFTDSLSLRRAGMEPGNVRFSMSVALLDSRGWESGPEGGAR